MHWKGFLFGRRPPWHGSLVRGMADWVCTEQCKLQTGWSAKRANEKQHSKLDRVPADDWSLFRGRQANYEPLSQKNKFVFSTFVQFIVVWCNLRLASRCFYLILIVMTTVRPTEKVPQNSFKQHRKWGHLLCRVTLAATEHMTSCGFGCTRAPSSVSLR